MYDHSCPFSTSGQCYLSSAYGHLSDPQVAEGVNYVLNNSGGDEKALLEDLLNAMTQAAFDPSNITAQRKAVSSSLLPNRPTCNV
jgi:hypothetical protein